MGRKSHGKNPTKKESIVVKVAIGFSASDKTLLAGIQAIVESKSHFNKNQTHGLELDRSHHLGGCFTIFQLLNILTAQH